MNEIGRKRILVLGDFGAFGQYIARRLAQWPEIELVLGAPEPHRLTSFAASLNASVVSASPDNGSSLAHALRDSYAVVNTFGSLSGGDQTVPAAAVELGVHYVDPHETREWIAAIEQLDRRAQARQVLMVSGASVAPALSAALIDLALNDFERLAEIHLFFSPGAKNRRELATARSIISYLDESVRIREAGRWRQAPGWRRPVTVSFPPPLGRRRGYVCDVPDLDLFPRRYGAQTVTARVAIGSAAFNRGVGLLVALKRAGAIQHIPPALARLLRAGARLVRPRPGAGLRVELRGMNEGAHCAQTLFLLTRNGNGHALAAAPLLALVRQWVTAGVSQFGARPCVGLMGWEELSLELMASGEDIVLQRDWRILEDRD